MTANDLPAPGNLAHLSKYDSVHVDLVIESTGLSPSEDGIKHHASEHNATVRNTPTSTHGGSANRKGVIQP